MVCKYVVVNINEVITERQIGAIPVIEDGNGQVIYSYGIEADAPHPWKKYSSSEIRQCSSYTESLWPQSNCSAVACIHTVRADHFSPQIDQFIGVSKQQQGRRR